MKQTLWLTPLLCAPFVAAIPHLKHAQKNQQNQQDTANPLEGMIASLIHTPQQACSGPVPSLDQSNQGAQGNVALPASDAAPEVTPVVTPVVIPVTSADVTIATAPADFLPASDPAAPALPITSVAAVASPAGSKGLWTPPVGAKFQIILSDLVDTNVGEIQPSNVDIFDIDMFNTPESTIKILKSQGKGVICYFSAGSSEDWRPDYKEFLPADKGPGICIDESCDSYWPGEAWLDTKSANVRKIMAARIALAAQKGCDGVDPDNIDAYNNKNGLGITKQDNIDYFNFLADTAHSHGIGIGVKNALEILDTLAPRAQFAVNEQCAEYAECDRYAGFLATKAVFHIEYVGAIAAPPSSKLRRRGLGFSSHSLSRSHEIARRKASDAQVQSACDTPSAMSNIIKTSDLTGVAQYCDGNVVATETTGGKK